MADHIQENIEQGEAVKKWLKENGLSIVLGVGLGLAAIFGYRTWGNYQVSQQLDAGAQYQAVSESLLAEDLIGARGYAAALSSEHQGSIYNAMANLSIAAKAVTDGDLELAEQTLRTVIATGKPEVMGHLATARLARLLLAKGAYQDAVALVSSAPTGFEAVFAEIRGDALAASGQADDAHAAYQTALDSMEANAGNRYLIELKQADLGVTASPGVTES